MPSQKNPYESKTFGHSLLLRVDGAIGAISLSPNGRDAVLAGRRGLFIIDLDDPFTTPRWLHHITSWEVADVQWSPHHFAKKSWCISTSNQKALLWDLARPSDNSIINVLHQHTRAITDINFHPSDPEILATCSIDTFVLSWDMRTPRKAVHQWAEWRAGATQVKWNHENPYEIASSHDHSFYIWDTRKGSSPVLKVADAHTGKINGVDFSHGLSKMVTCSNDHKIKYWDLTNGKTSPSVVINTDFPVSRARSLPFGTEEACGIMPLRDGGDSIHIVNCDEAVDRYNVTNETQTLAFDPVFSFKGHGGPIKDFLWRTRHETYDHFVSKRGWKDYQLVTWSLADYDLKLWSADDEFYTKINYNPLYHKALKVLPNNVSAHRDHVRGHVTSPESRDTVYDTKRKYNYDTYCMEPPVALNNVLAKNKGDLVSAMAMFQIARKHKNLTLLPTQLNHLDWISGVRMGNDEDRMSNTPSSLGEEVSVVAHTFPKVRFEKISISTGHLTLSLRGPAPVLASGSASTAHADPPAAKKTAGTGEDDAETTGDGNLGSESVAGALDIDNNDEYTGDDNGDNEQKLIFIRLDISFPRTYPFLEANTAMTKANRKRMCVTFDIEETHELTKDIKQEMLAKLHEIAYFYSNRYQRYCLEPLLRYLIGDKVVLEDASFADKKQEMIQEIGDEGWADDLVNQESGVADSDLDSDADSELSDDLDGQVSDFMPALNDEDMATSNGSLAKYDSNAKDDGAVDTSRIYSAPLPKGCGATWSNNGQLVCFFIPKAEEDDTFQKFSIFKFTAQGFSLRTHSGHEHHEAHGGGSEHADARPGDTSSVSGDSLASDWDDEWDIDDDPTTKFRVPGLFKTAVGLGNRYFAGHAHPHASNDGSNYKSSYPGNGLVDARKLRPKTPKNILGIFDFRHLIPDKQELANEYRVLGASPEQLANYNSQVALKHGLTEISRVWKLLEMVLLKDIQINTIHPVYFGHDLLNPNVPTSDLQAINNLIEIAEHKTVPDNNYRFYWGTHPFGHSWLVARIMHYFEQRQNLQMLAMISCILHENERNFHRTLAELNIPVHTPYQARPPPPPPREVSQPHRSRSLHGSVNSEKADSVHVSKHRTLSSLTFRRDYSYPVSLNSDIDDSDRKPPKFSDLKRIKGPQVLSVNPKRITKDVRHPPEVVVEFENIDALDLFDDVYTTALLSSQNADKIKSYREKYADMLYAWGFPANRIKMLKFNFATAEPHKSSFVEHNCEFGYRPIESLSSDLKYVNVANNRRPQTQNTYCNLCNLLVTKRIVICSNCEHILHANCALQWWGQQENECPSGCGCQCGNYIF